MTFPLREAVGSACLLLAALACGGEPATGPVEPHWDRDACERCNMSVSDARFAAQVRDADGHAHLFDDLGCAVLWMDEELGQDPPREIWVRDRSGQGWLEARSAHYLAGEQTPMDYGFGATQESSDAALDFEAARAGVRAMERERRDSGR
jgi:hypothetical protein